MSETGYVSLWIPGRRTGQVAKATLVSALILLTVLGSLGTVLPGIVQALAPLSSPSTTTQNTKCPPTPPNATTTSTSCSPTNMGSNTPQSVGADTLPNLSLPKTVLSSVDNMIGEGGIVQTSPDNLTLYNLSVKMRLLGGPFPHDELLGSDMRVLSSMSLWRVEAQVGPAWLPLLPTSSNFTLLGTTTAGTSVVRTMEVRTSVYSGVLRIVYKALSSGPLKWDLQFTSKSSATYRLAYEWLNLTTAATLSGPTSNIRVGYGTENYTFSWNDIPKEMIANPRLDAKGFSLTISLGYVAPERTVSVDPRISSSTDPTASGFTFQRKVFYDPKGGYYFAFYYDGIAIGYSSSRDGVTWSSRQSITGLLSYKDSASSFPSVYVAGQTIILVAGDSRSNTWTCISPPCSFVDSAQLYYVQGTISGSSISWQSSQTIDTLPVGCIATGPTISTCSTFTAVRYVNVGTDSSGHLVFSYNGALSGGGWWGKCTYTATYESDIIVIFNGQRFVANCEQGILVAERSVVLAAPGGVRVVYTTHVSQTGTVMSGQVQLMSEFLHGSGSSLSPVTANADAYLDSSNPDTTYGTQNDLKVESQSTYSRYTYLGFNLPAIPANSQFSGAKLSLTWNVGISGNVNRMIAGAIQAPWTETYISWHSAINNGATPDAPYTGLGSFNCGGGGCVAGSTTGPVDISQTVWRLYLVNYGIALMIGDGSYTAYDFKSRESGYPASLTVYYNCCIDPAQTIDSNVADGDSFSALADANNGIHAVYQGATNTNVTYAYLSPSSTTWTWTNNIFAGSFANPAITVDYSTNDVYAFAVPSPSLSSIVMKSKTPTGSWTDGSAIFPVTNRTNIRELGSNLASVSTTNSSSISLVWTEGNGPFNVTFASIPIQTVWSPYSNPGDPWDGNGLAPYGQYFANLGESVSPSTGMLTVKQTDLSVPGRGLDLSITRVYTEPYSFLSNAPYLFEKYPWVPMGDGWQLNFPWLNNTSQPTYLHVGDGEGYRIPSSFWTGSTATFENHHGENFRLMRNLDGSIRLYDKSGTTYYFNTTSHMLRTITDSSGNNTITFIYAGNTISCITDAVNRAFTFTYSNGLLQAISQVTGTCGSHGTTVRTINYANNGQSLTSVTDPAGRVTGYAYNATGGAVAPWLLSRVRYPTSWLTNYTYTSAPLGTQAYTYRVNLQKIGALPTLPSSPVRQFAYIYNSPVGDRVTNSTVTAYNGTQVATHTKYAFSFAGMSSNVTDSNNIFVRGIVQRFGVGGETPREIILVSPTQGYTNYYNYDLWGNLIYSRSTISSSPAKSHESFDSYYNNGEPPGFYAFQDSFSQNQGTAADNPWTTYNGTWLVQNGVYNGTETGLSADSTFAWANISRTDLSLQSKVSVTRAVDTRPGYLKFGIFTHHSTWLYKWALVIHDIGSSQYLELLDEWNAWLGYTQPSARNPCSSWTIPLNSTRVWYTFNMTVHGTQATGWISAPGQNPCSVSGIFSSSSPAIGGTAFGLYSGGYSALFDDVQAATVSPTITGTGFSNSFFQNGAPGPVGLNTWLATTKPPNVGWNTTMNWLPATAWSQAYAVQNYGGGPWNNITGWTDRSAQWIWWDSNANVTGSKDPVWFRRVFNLTAATSISVGIVSDNTYVLYLDGTKLGAQLTSNWANTTTYTRSLPAGNHLLAINATNPDGPDPAGLLVSVSVAGTGPVLFRTDGRGGPVLTAPAGRAALQNGLASLPEETYYSYYPSGGLNQTRTRYDPPAAQGTSNPISIDGSATAFCPSSSNTCSASLTTSHSNDVIIAFTTEDLDALGNSCSFSVSDTAGLGWFVRSGIVYSQSGRDEIQEFWTTSASALSSDTITESIVGCGNNANGVHVFAISGASLSQPFDPYYGLPGYGSGSGSGTGIMPSIFVRVSNPGDILFSGIDSYGGTVTGAPGFAVITNDGSHAMDYQLTTTPVSESVMFADSGSQFYWGQIADAVEATPRAQWVSTSRTYDFYGNPKTVTDALGNRVYYTFGSLTNYTYAYLTNETRLNGTSKTTALYAYNFTTGNIRIATDPMGNVTSYQNDNLGRITRTSYPLGAFTQNTYNDQASYVDITNENGWKTRQIYDGLGRETTVDRFLNGISYSNESYSHNYQDKIINQYDAFGHIYNNTYDALGRLVQILKPDGNKTSIFYNDLQSWVVSTDEYGNHRCNVHDRLGRLLSVVEYSDATCNPLALSGGTLVTNYFYDESGNLLKISNAAVFSTLYSYDNLGRLTSDNYPDETFELYTYDNNGNLIRKIDRANIKTLFSYDSLNRVSTTTYCGTSVTSMTSTNYAYDKNNNPVQIQNENATLQYKYDQRNRTTNQTYLVNLPSRQIVDLGCRGGGGTSTTSGGTAKTYTVLYKYNGEVLDSITYPAPQGTPVNIVAKYSYDSLGRVLSLTQNGTSNYYASSFTYNKDDTLKGLLFGNNLLGNYTYDKLARTASINITYGSLKYLTLGYTYNNTGTVASVKGSLNFNGATNPINEQYRYDPMGRLTNSSVTSQGTAATIWYQYDNLGNRLRQSINGALTTYTYNYANSTLTNTSHGVSYSYDANGNLKTENINSTSWTYAWNSPGNLLNVSRAGTIQGAYAYDGLGRQVESVDPAASFYAYQTTETLYQWYGSGGYGIDYLTAGGLRIARVDASTGSFASVRYYGQDRMGSTRLVTGSTRWVIFADGYQPFGQDNGSPGSAENYRFTGKPFSAATGLYYEYQRWYDPGIGRFISRDPLRGHKSNPQTLNPYVYVLDSPTSLTDPSGMDGDGGGFLGLFDQYVSRPYLSWFNHNVEVPILTFETGLPQATVEKAVNQNAALENTLFDAGVVAGVVIASAAILTPYVLGTVAPTALGACEEDPQACDLTVGDYTISGTARASFADGEAYPASLIRGYQYGSYPGYATRWLTPTLYSNPGQVAAEESLPESNTALWMREAFPRTQGEIVWVGKAAPVPYLPGTGGGIQFMASSSSVLTGGPWVPTISALLRLPS